MIFEKNVKLRKNQKTQETQMSTKNEKPQLTPEEKMNNIKKYIYIKDTRGKNLMRL